MHLQFQDDKFEVTLLAHRLKGFWQDIPGKILIRNKRKIRELAV